MGAGRDRGQRARRRARPHRAQPGAADDGRQPARVNRRPAVDRRLLQPGARGADPARPDCSATATAASGCSSSPWCSSAPASLACAYATSVGELIAARAVLGIGAAAIFPLALSVLPVLFDGAERQRAVAAIGGATMLSFPIGPIVGGYLLDHFWWGSVFLINVPVVVHRADRRRDPAARVPVGARGRASTCRAWSSPAPAWSRSPTASSRPGQDGWSDATAAGADRGGRRRARRCCPWWSAGSPRRGGQPLADLRLFRSAGFRWGTILATLVSFAMFGMFFALPQYFQDVRGADALGSGVRLLPAGRRHAGRHGGRHAPARRGAGARRARGGPRPGRGAGDGRVPDHGRRDGARRAHHARQLDRVRARLGRPRRASASAW